MSADTKKVVIAALAGNLAIAVCKFAAAYLSKSTATLAEAVHSLADTGNQALLLIGMRLALRPATARFPFGRASEKYFWPFVVALLLFSVGGAFAVFEGISRILEPAKEQGSRLWSFGVLGISLLFEGLSFRVAWNEFKVLAKGKPLKRAIFETRDPTIPLVLAEDTSALIGLTIAIIAVGISAFTGRAIFDSLGSIAIGLLLCVVAIGVAWLTHGLLIGEGASPEDQVRVIEIARSTDGVEDVTQLLTLHLGPDEVILAFKIAFRKTLTVREVEATTNEIERRIRDNLPQMRKIFIEADSDGDMNDLESSR